MLSKGARRTAPAILAAVLAAAALGARHAIGSSTDPQQLRSLIDEILSSPGYEVNPPLSWLIERWIIQQLHRAVDAMSRLSQIGPLANLPQWAWWAIVGLSVVLLVLIIGHLVMSIRGLMQEPRRRRAEERAAGTPRTPEAALREAEAAAAAGQFALALRRLYEAALLRLDRLELLRYDPSRTNWENLRGATADHPGLRAALAPLTVAVDGCLYGDQPATRDLFDDCRELVRRLWRPGGASDG